ncbi:MAG: endolytic transglycosylase MltG [Spirochaetes bacterium]|jgi:UPF0755 protein|nr:endolytic transglycosylase MltG [Spirochaetota bacterium]
MKRTTLRIALIIALVASALGFIALNSAPSMMQGEDFIVREGESVRGVARRLKALNLITSENFFHYSGRLAGKIAGSGIRKGKYRIAPGSSSLRILYALMRGDVVTARVTVPEGFNLYQIAARLEASGVTGEGEFLYYAFNPSHARALGVDAPSVEGYLFPDTYIMPEASDARDVIALMYRRTKTVLARLDSALLRESGLSAHALLTLASLIEKETAVGSERARVASVFRNRLNKNMKLDCDPTVRYATRKFTGRIGYRDLAYDSPFNTYLYRGLPPTPICSPGLASIEAALSPETTDYLYFVSRNDGSHYFSKTLKEHNRAVQYYQKGIGGGFRDDQRR